MPDNRFDDARHMQDAWRAAVEQALENDARRPWWRLWSSEDGTEGI
jgi:hypothetical protein